MSDGPGLEALPILTSSSSHMFVTAFPWVMCGFDLYLILLVAFGLENGTKVVKSMMWLNCPQLLIVKKHNCFVVDFVADGVEWNG